MSFEPIRVVRRARLKAGAAVVAVVAAGLGLAGAAPTPIASAAPGVFTTSGTVQSFTVPSWVTLVRADVRGGKGGNAGGISGGNGARIVGDIDVTPGQSLFVGVGLGAGAAGDGSGSGNSGGAGGGASDVRTCLQPTSTCTGWYTTANDPRVIVAGGGGGAGGDSSTNTVHVGGAGGSSPGTTTCASGGNGSDGTDGVDTTGHGGGGSGGTCATGGAAGASPGSSGSGGPAAGFRNLGGKGGTAAVTGGGGGGGGGGFFGGGGGGASAGGGGGGGGAGSSREASSVTNFSTGSNPSVPSVRLSYRPSPPTNVSAVSEASRSMTVSWQPPVDSGGADVITGYVVALCQAGPSCGAPVIVPASARSHTFTMLTNGQTYFASVQAENSVGDSDVAFSNGVTPVSVPDAPTGVHATAGNMKATVTWSVPANNGSPITSYTVRSTDGTVVKDVEGSVTSVTITGLQNGVAYQFTVEATNANGTGPKSAPSNTVIPNPTVPGAPQSPHATAGNAQATVTWSAPADDGGSPITQYTVTSTPGGHTATADGSTFSAVVTGLSNGVSYTFTIKATNSVGTGPGATTNAVTPGADVPGAPTGVTATAGNASATVSWTAPSSDGGASITSYGVKKCPTSPPASCTLAATVPAPATSTTVSGLTNGTTYVFVVFATNSSGNGPDSTPSNAVTPSGPNPPPSVIYSQNWNAFAPQGWTQSSSSSAPNWHLTSACAANHTGGGGFAWYYGKDSDCTYNNGTTNSGSLLSPNFGNKDDAVGKTIVVPKNVTFHMGVWSKRKVESCSSCSHDQTVIHVNYNDGRGWQRVYYADAHNPSSGTYQFLSIALKSPTGQVQVRFRFSSVSSVLNSFFGWAIDDFALTN